MQILLALLGGIFGALLTFTYLDNSTVPTRNTSYNYEVAVACGNSYLLGCQQPVNDLIYCTNQANVHAKQLFETLENAK